MTKSYAKNLIQLNAALLLMSTSGPLGRLIDMPPPLTIWSRCVLGSLFLLAFCKINKVNLRVNWPHDGISFILGAILLGTHWVTYFFALKLSSVAIGMLSLFTYPVFTAFLEPLILKTKFQQVHLWLALIILSGIFILAPEFSLENDTTLGITCGLISSLFYTLRNILLKKKVTRYSGSSLMFYQLFILTIVGFPVLFLYPISPIGTEWPELLALSLITTAAGHTLFVLSFKNFSVSTASLISACQPIFGIILGVIFLNEIPESKTIIGGSLILTTVIIESLRSSKTA